PIAAQPLSVPLLSSAPPAELAMKSKSLFSFSGKRPTNLGVKAGKLAACPNSPNCVSSQADASDPEHRIEAIAYRSAPAEALDKLKTVIETMERTQIITASDNYLYAEFTSRLMGFVDDVEFYQDTNAGVFQVRSASRLGESDLGVNRKRIETIRTKLAELES
ncbi:MAG TPA: DUF1499 domain-containing protein, partial [Coleofasciculaceae cyanobacterium]